MPHVPTEVHPAVPVAKAPAITIAGGKYISIILTIFVNICSCFTYFTASIAKAKDTISPVIAAILSGNFHFYY